MTAAVRFNTCFSSIGTVPTEAWSDDGAGNGGSCELLNIGPDIVALFNSGWLPRK